MKKLRKLRLKVHLLSIVDQSHKRSHLEPKVAFHASTRPTTNIPRGWTRSTYRSKIWIAQVRAKIMVSILLFKRARTLPTRKSILSSATAWALIWQIPQMRWTTIILWSPNYLCLVMILKLWRHRKVVAFLEPPRKRTFLNRKHIESRSLCLRRQILSVEEATDTSNSVSPRSLIINWWTRKGLRIVNICANKRKIWSSLNSRLILVCQSTFPWNTGFCFLRLQVAGPFH